MNCYDCANQGRTTAAVAVCSRCGAAVCGGCVHSQSRPLNQHATIGPLTPGETRTLLCAKCSHVLAGHALDPAL